MPDEQAADEDLTQLFMPLVGALAWLTLTMPAICIYVAFLQRQCKAPTLGHVRRANRLLRWIRRNKVRLGIWFQRLKPPLRVMTLSDSAFKAQDYQGLVMRAALYCWPRLVQVLRKGLHWTPTKQCDAKFWTGIRESIPEWSDPPTPQNCLVC